MSLMKIKARDLLAYPTETLENMLTGKFIIVFDNGEGVETNAAKTLYTSYIWDIFRVYNQVPILPKHHIEYHLKKINFGSKTTIHCYSEIFKTLVETYRNDPTFLRDGVMRLIYSVNNNLYNKMSSKAAAWQVSLDILDFERILSDEDIQKIKRDMTITPVGVDQAQKDIVEVLLKSNKLDDSTIARGVRADILSKGQVAKCIGPCGYVTDIDSFIFPKPVLRGYAEGLRSIYDSLIESRSGAKSLQFSKKPLQDTEYFSRRLQFITMNVKNLHFGDCGTKKYLHWYVRPDSYDEEGRLIQKSDLGNLIGKYYLAEDGTLKVITKEDTHLIGKTIKLRSVLHCNHDDPYGICSTCLGELSYGVPKDANIGHLCAVTMASPVSQAVLSVKHLDGTAIVEGVSVSDMDKRFVSAANSGKSYKLNKSLLKHKPKLVLSSEVASRLSNVMDVDDVRDLNITRTTEMDTIVIEYYENPPKGDFEDAVVVPDRHMIPISIKRRLGSLTHEFLEYIKKVGWTYDKDNNFIIDLSQWNFDELFITLPLKHHSMADHSSEIEKLIESSVKDRSTRLKRTTPSDLVTQLFDLVNSKTNVNIAVLEVIIYSTSIVSDEDYDYSLPKERTKFQFGVASNIMTYRSISAAMAFEGHLKVLSDPVNFLYTRKPNHPFDALVVPEQMNK